MKYVMAVNQYGNTLHGLDAAHPRKSLLERLGVSNCKKQYQDKEDGSCVHTGYIVGHDWYTLYEVRPWEKPE